MPRHFVIHSEEEKCTDLDKSLVPQVCSPCYSLLGAAKPCPECRGQYDSPVRRNVLAERLIASATFAVSCGNMECEEMVLGREVGEHMAECKHREVPCPFIRCRNRIKLGSVREHIKLHRPVMCINLKFKFGLSEVLKNNFKNKIEFIFPLQVFKQQGQRFYLQCFSRNKMFIATVKVEGGREEAARWRVTVTIPSARKTVSCESEVFPMDMSTTDMINSGECLFLMEKEVERFFGDGVIPVDINIKQV